MRAIKGQSLSARLLTHCVIYFSYLIKRAFLVAERFIMAVNHEVAHNIISGLSFTDEGRDLVNRLEAMRYYHRDGESFI